MANEKRLFLGYVIPRAPITHGPVPVRTHAQKFIVTSKRLFVTSNVRLHTALNEELSDSIDTDG